MKTPHSLRLSQQIRVVVAALTAVLIVHSSRASDGTWNNAAGGNWSAPGNWAGGNVADGGDGSASTAFFNALDLTADITITLDSARTNGNLVFADTDASTTANWILSGNNIRMSGSNPTITVTNMGSGRATISSILVGTNGFAPNGLKVIGNSRLDLTGANAFTNLTIDGATVGMSVVQSPGVNVTNNVITLTNGGAILITVNQTWLQTIRNRGSNAFLRLPGVAGGGNWNGMFTGDGTLYVNLAGVQMTFGGGNAWNSNLFANFTGTLVLDGGGNFRFDENNAATTTFGSRFATFDLGQTNNTMNERGANGIAVHTTYIGALKGGPATAMACNGTGGTTNTFQIGDANLDTTFFGRINNGTPTAVTKSGTGTLTLAGTNAYTGITTVQNGRLVLATTGSISNSPVIKVVSPGIFDVTAYGIWTNNLNQSFQGDGTVTGAVSMASGTISPGNAPNNTATVTFASGLILAGGVTVIHDVVSPTAVDSVLVNGDLDLSGANTVQLVPTLANVIVTNGTYVLYQWTGNLIGDVSSLTLSYPAQLGSLTLSTNVSKQIVLTVAGASLVNLTWRGDQGSDWSAANNWRDTNGSPVSWSDARVALLDNSSVTKSVNLSAAVAPARTVVDSTSDYLLASTGGRITGAGLMVKSGSGRLTLTTLNDYTGTTTINSNATLQIGDGSSPGSIGTGALFNDGTFIVNRPDGLLYGSVISGAGSVIQNGPGQLTITGDQAYTGGTSVTNGATLQLGDGTINGSLQGMVTLSNTATLTYLNNANSVIVNNSLSGAGSVTYQFPANRTFTYGATVTNTAFTGPLLVKQFTRVEVPSIAASPSGPITVEDGGSVYFHAGAFTNAQSITLTGQGPGTGVDQPRGFGALRLNNGWAGPINMSGNTTIGASSGTGTVLGNISDGSNNFTLEYFGGTIQVGPATGVNTYGTTRISEGLTGGAPGVSGNTIVIALNSNAFSTGPIEMSGQATLRLNGNDIAVANLIDSSIPLNAVSNFAPVIQNASTTTAASLTVGADGNSQFFAGVFSDGGTQPLGLRKVGAGILTLTGDHTSTGPVTVSGGTLALAAASGNYANGQPVVGSGSFSNAATLTVDSSAVLDVNGRSDLTLTLNNGQTLKGNGTVNGNVVALAGATVAPGNSVGTLTVQGNITLGGTLLMELNRTNTPSTSDHLTASGTITYGGTLVITNIGPELAVNDTFQVFPAGVSGFGSVNIATHDANNKVYTWQNDIGTLGSVKVLSVTNGVNTTPGPITVTQGTGVLNLAWSADRTGWTLQTNGVGLAATNAWFEYPAGSGSRNTNQVTLAIDPSKTNVFFRLIYP